MKRTIGKIALVVAAISLFLWSIIVVTGSGFNPNGPGLNGFAILVFASWAVSIFTAIFCLAGDIIKFIGKMFASGYNSANYPPTPQNVKYCAKCGKQIDASSTFCPNCGEKLN